MRVLQWHILDLTVNKHTILRDIEGHVHSGTFLAILGPSGSGKSSFLECISVRNRNFNGDILLDGKPLTRDFFHKSAYLYQDEHFFNYLTTYEHVYFHAVSRLGGALSSEQYQEKIQQVLTQVGLQDVQDVTIGGGHFGTVKGLSGGQKKRLSIATELLTDPQVIFLDEPTSGLDFVSSHLICQLLQDVAQQNRTVVSVMHTPSFQSFQTFSHVLLLTADGCVAYQGPRENVEGFFAAYGLYCPPRCNIADFALEQLSSTKIKTLNDNITQLHVPVYSAHKHLVGCRVSPTACSFWTSFRLNLWRAYAELARDTRPRKALLLMSSIVGIIFGMLYYQGANNVRNVSGLILAVDVMVLITGSTQVTLHFPVDTNILVREYYAGSNRISAYFIGRTLADLPLCPVIALSALLPYWLAGLQYSAPSFFSFALVTLLLALGSQSLGYLASSASTSPNVCFAVVPLLVMPTSLFSGVLYQRGTISHYLSWLERLSVVNYAVGLQAVGQRSRAPLILRFLGLGESDVATYTVGLILCVVGFRVLALTLLLYRVPRLQPV